MHPIGSVAKTGYAGVGAFQLCKGADIEAEGLVGYGEIIPHREELFLRVVSIEHDGMPCVAMGVPIEPYARGIHHKAGHLAVVDSIDHEICYRIPFTFYKSPADFLIEDPGAAGKGIGDAIIQQQTAILMSVGFYLQKPVCQPWKTGFCIYDGKHCSDFRVRGYIGQGNAAFCIHVNLPFIKFRSLFMRQLYGLRLS